MDYSVVVDGEFLCNDVNILVNHKCGTDSIFSKYGESTYYCIHDTSFGELS